MPDLYNGFLYGLLALYIVCVARLLTQKKNKDSTYWLTGAFVCWPLFMLDEWLRLGEITDLAELYGISEVFAVIGITCCYRAIKPMLYANPTARKRLWWPVFVTVLMQLTVIFISVEDKQQWFVASPTGEPLALWPAYLSSLLTGFSVLLIGILIAEHIQMYHRYLPQQAVDISRLKMPKLAGVMGGLVGLAFFSILLVTAATFGFLPVPFWESGHHLMLGTGLLLVLFSLTFVRRTSPSPLDYQRLDLEKASPYETSSIISKAERYAVQSKAFTKSFLTIDQFCRNAGLDPTSLALALQVTQRKSFRHFIFSYRLAYAKDVLFKHDPALETVATQLGIQSDKFLSDHLIKRFNAHKP